MAVVFLANLLQQNKYFFRIFFAFIILGFIALLVFEHGDWIVFFSDQRNFWVDNFFRYWTKVGEEPAYIIAIILLCFVKFRYVVFVPIIGLVVTVVANLLKAFFAQPRPRLFYEMNGLLEQINLIEGVILNSGATSFPSGHTMSGFALFSFVAFCLPQKKVVAGFLFLNAFLVGLSRIVLVQHFLRDIYVGGIIGVLLAILIFYLQSLLSDNPQKWWNKSILREKVA
ncbi:MAG: phosphatase PAP2 family protein [Saprospiraceae bacterium]